MRLLNEEYNVLNKIATESKMDCWFCLAEDKKGNDYVLDIENDCKLTIAQGVSELVEGMTDYEDYHMTPEEIEVFEELLDKLNIMFIPEK